MQFFRASSHGVGHLSPGASNCLDRYTHTDKRTTGKSEQNPEETQPASGKRPWSAQYRVKNGWLQNVGETLEVDQVPARRAIDQIRHDGDQDRDEGDEHQHEEQA